MKATTIRMNDDTLEHVDGLAQTLSRSRTWVINQAVQRYLDYEEWFVREVKQGLEEVDRGEIATQAQVKAAFRKWGADVGCCS
ncbi:MAG: CopG family ribbon-helix-helix protein [Thermodesulfobacteriota bacterium]|nr:CopG family ribbon-helix-helix protein [Thermodesulfobacteriota bacterium]